MDSAASSIGCPTSWRLSQQGKVVHVVEGKKDADNLGQAWISGDDLSGRRRKSGNRNTTKPCAALMLSSFQTTIIPVTNMPNKLRPSLNGTAKRVRVFDIAKHWPECPDGGDISAWLETGGTADQLSALIAEQAEWKRAEAAPSGTNAQQVSLTVDQAA